jgi:quercetin dioxygenase-like cupin family protein
MKNTGRIATRMVFTGALLAAASALALAADPLPKGFSSFGQDQTIADIGKVDWQPLQLEGLPPGIEIAALRGDLSKGGGEILLRLPANYTVPNHSHTSDELYVWLKGAFTYIAADGKQAEIDGPAYISSPGNTPHALKCHNEPCVLTSATADLSTCIYTRCQSSQRRKFQTEAVPSSNGVDQTKGKQ